MPVITSITHIQAPAERVFDLARSVQVHLATSQETGGATVESQQTNLLEEGDEVTWTGKHLGFEQTLTLKFSQMKRPDAFVGKMMQGAFLRLHHRYFFETGEKGTVMKDEFDYASRRGLLGVALDNIFLTAYLRSFLAKRNKALKQIAESERWQEFLPPSEVS